MIIELTKNIEVGDTVIVTGPSVFRINTYIGMITKVISVNDYYCVTDIGRNFTRENIELYDNTG